MELNDKNFLQYKVGALLYMPAFQKNIVEKIKNNSICCLNSVAFCLEDSIQDNALAAAEETLKNILYELNFVYKNSSNKNLPLIFIRPRTPEHLKFIHEKFSDSAAIITGYILPKFDLSNAEKYCAVIREINCYVMPTFESEQVADLSTRAENLIALKKILDGVKEHVLNIRVGVNDLSNLYNLRRNVNCTVYDIGIVRDILIDILNVFARDYVVAGSVWNYFGKEKGAWSDGLIKELTLDKINGFIGKSAIHPSQLPYIFESLKVSQADLNDAEQILNWDSESLGVVKGSGRMNELKCHSNWAQKIKILSEIYGVKQ